jgi:hypothetical protein
MDETNIDLILHLNQTFRTLDKESMIYAQAYSRKKP